MAFSVFFKMVQNHEELRFKGIPWLCDKCHCEDEVLLKMIIDYDTVVLCKKCLLEAKKIITDMEKELKNERKNSSNDKTRRRSPRSDRRSNKKN